MAEGSAEFASDALCAQLDAEIQDIYRAIRKAEGKASTKRGFWTSDGQCIELVLDWEAGGGVTEAARKAVARAGGALGIPLDPSDLWEDAALRLRDKRRGVKEMES